MTQAPRPTYSPLSACLLTCSGRTQYALPDASPADHAFDHASANAHASCNVASPAFEPSFTTQLGAPWMSACTYRSPSFRCFFTIASFVFASRPPMTRNPSEDRNQRYASNQNAFVAFTRGLAATLAASFAALPNSRRDVSSAFSTFANFSCASRRRPYWSCTFPFTSSVQSSSISATSATATRRRGRPGAGARPDDRLPELAERPLLLLDATPELGGRILPRGFGCRGVIHVEGKGQPRRRARESGGSRAARAPRATARGAASSTPARAHTTSAYGPPRFIPLASTFTIAPLAATMEATNASADIARGAAAAGGEPAAGGAKP